jgi:protein O-mannosyl-transferase
MIQVNSKSTSKCTAFGPVLVLWFSTMVLPVGTISAQDTKSVRPVNQSTNPPVHQTRAVVVGISDYQDPAIPDLRFAHRDAEVFAEWLKSPAGGSVPADNVRLFVNDRATQAAIIVALFDLLDVCQTGDQVVFYFSGHGDVEAKIRSQPGFLLAHDSPAKVYATNAINLRDLDDIVAELTARQVRVVLVTDACHAGKLAGSATGGSKATALALQQQFANSVRILSCQPDEFSLEGEQWGGGRGVFSYHLVDGLTGLADHNSDGAVSLFEIRRYLEDRVPAEAAPHPQMPLTAGDLSFRLAAVDGPSLSALKQRTTAAAMLSSTGSKGIEDEVLARADSLTRARYQAFRNLLDSDADLLADADTSVGGLFAHLMAAEVLRPLHGILRREFAVALLDDVQQALNALLADDPYEANNWRYNPDKYDRYPEYLQRAMDLLGEQHHLQRSLLSKKRYFEGYLFARKIVDASEATVRDSLRDVAKSKYLEAAALEPEAPYLYHAIGSLYFINNPSRTDSMQRWMEKAMELAPTWQLPYLDLSYEYSLSQSDVAETERWLNQVLAQGRDSYVVLERLSWLYQWQNRTQESLMLCDTMIARKPELFNAWSTKGVTHLMRNEYPEADVCFRRSIELEPGLHNWGIYYQNMSFGFTRQWARAKDSLDRMLSDEKVDNLSASALLHHALLPLYFQRKITEQKPYFEHLRAIELYPSHVGAALCGLGMISYRAGNLQEAEAYLQKSLEIDSSLSGNKIIRPVSLAMIAAQLGDRTKADSLFQVAFEVSTRISALEKAFTYASCRLEYGRLLMRQGRIEDAKRQFRLAEEFQPKCYEAQYGYALLAAAQKRQDEALDYLEKALDYWLPEAEPVLEEPLFKKIRKTRRFKALMEKHFP